MVEMTLLHMGSREAASMKHLPYVLFFLPPFYMQLVAIEFGP